jgi:hypothetical protein
MPSKSLAAIIDLGAIQEPPTAATFSRARWSTASSALIPPIGTKRTSGSGTPTAEQYLQYPADW